METLYLVTGAAGHLGRILLDELRKKGAPFRALVLPGEKHLPDGDIFYGDVCDKSSIRPCFENLNGQELVVIHCAGIVSIATHFNQRVYDVNVTGTRNVVALCREYGAKLLYVSSVHALEEKGKGEVIRESLDFSPDKVIGHYAKTKAEATALVLEATREGLWAIVVHPSGILGPGDYGDGHLTALVIDFFKGRITSGIYGGYDFVDVRDVAAGILLALEKGQPGQGYILSNRFITVKEIFKLLHEVTGKREIKSYLPLWFVKGSAPLAEIYYRILRRPPLFTPYSIYTLGSNARFSHEKATRDLGYTPRAMRETLADTVAWLKEAGRI